MANHKVSQVVSNCRPVFKLPAHGVHASYYSQEAVRWYRDKTPRRTSRKFSGPKGLLATNLIELLLVSRHYKPTICEISMSKNENTTVASENALLQ